MPTTSQELIKRARQFIDYKKDRKTRIATLTLNRPDHLDRKSVV